MRVTAGDEVERTDARYGEWMRGNLARAAEHFRLTLTGEPIFGWRLRSIGARVRGGDGAGWLRVVSERPQWLPGQFSTGNLDANVITNVVKPRVLDTTEWDEPGWRRVRAELMTLMPGRPCSATDVLREAIDLPESWWGELRRTLDVISATPTSRTSADQDKVTQRVEAVFGRSLDVRIQHWETAHGDLQWSNLLGPEFGLLDWEWWGRGPAGTDAATLYCYSLLVPTIARRVHTVFADVLDSPAGRVAQVYVAARLLSRAAQDYPDLADPLRQHIQPLLSEVTE